MHSYPLQGYIIILSLVSTTLEPNSARITFENGLKHCSTGGKLPEGNEYNDSIRPVTEYFCSLS